MALKAGIQLSVDGKGNLKVIDLVRGDVRKLNAETRKSRQELKALNKRSAESAASMRKLSSSIKIGAAIFATWRLSKRTDELRVLEARIQRVTKATGDYNTVNTQLTKTAYDNGLAVKGTTDLFINLQRAGKSLNKTNTDVLQVTNSVQQLGVISGASTEAMKNSLRQFSQAMAGGIVRAEEWNSIVENTPEIADRIAQGMGKTTGEIRQMVVSGKLLSEDVFETLLKQSDAIQKDFEKMPLTMDRATARLGINFDRALDAANDLTGATSLIANGMNEVAEGVGDIADYIESGYLEADSSTWVQFAEDVGGVYDNLTNLLEWIDAFDNESKRLLEFKDFFLDMPVWVGAAFDIVVAHAKYSVEYFRALFVNLGLQIDSVAIGVGSAFTGAMDVTKLAALNARDYVAQQFAQMLADAATAVRNMPGAEGLSDSLYKASGNVSSLSKKSVFDAQQTLKNNTADYTAELDKNTIAIAENRAGLLEAAETRDITIAKAGASVIVAKRERVELKANAVQLNENNKLIRELEKLEAKTTKTIRKNTISTKNNTKAKKKLTKEQKELVKTNQKLKDLMLDVGGHAQVASLNFESMALKTLEAESAAGKLHFKLEDLSPSAKAASSGLDNVANSAEYVEEQARLATETAEGLGYALDQFFKDGSGENLRNGIVDALVGDETNQAMQEFSKKLADASKNGVSFSGTGDGSLAGLFSSGVKAYLDRSTGNSYADAINAYGSYQSSGGTDAYTDGKGNAAKAGAKAGSSFGVWGAVIGGVLGWALGRDNNPRIRAGGVDSATERKDLFNAETDRYRADLANNSYGAEAYQASHNYGSNKNYYKTDGWYRNKYLPDDFKGAGTNGGYSYDGDFGEFGLVTHKTKYLKKEQSEAAAEFLRNARDMDSAIASFLPDDQVARITNNLKSFENTGTDLESTAYDRLSEIVRGMSDPLQEVADLGTYHSLELLSNRMTELKAAAEYGIPTLESYNLNIGNLSESFLAGVGGVKNSKEAGKDIAIAVAIGLAEGAGTIDNLVGLINNSRSKLFTVGEVLEQELEKAREGIYQFNDAAGLSGAAAINSASGLKFYIQNLETSGALTTEIGRENYIAALEAVDSFALIRDELETLNSTFGDSKNVLSLINTSSIDAQRGLAGFAGGIDNLSSLMSSYISSVYNTDEQKLIAVGQSAQALSALNAELGLVGASAIDTRQELKDKINSLNNEASLAIEGNQELLVKLLSFGSDVATIEDSDFTSASAAIKSLPADLLAVSSPLSETTDSLSNATESLSYAADYSSDIADNINNIVPIDIHKATYEGQKEANKELISVIKASDSQSASNNAALISAIEENNTKVDDIISTRRAS